MVRTVCSVVTLAASMKDLVLSHFSTWYYVQALRPKIEGAELFDAYAVSKEQMVFHFVKNQSEFHIILYTSGFNAFFWAQETYGKPRSKFQTQYKSLFGQKCKKLICFDRERSFAISFGSESLVFALFGRVNHVLKRPTETNEWLLELPGGREVRYEPTQKVNVETDFLTKVLGKSVESDQLERSQKAIEEGRFDLGRNAKEQLVFSFGMEDPLFSSRDIFEVLKRYRDLWFREFHFSHTYERIQKHLLKEKSKTEKSLQAVEQQIHRLEHDQSYRLWADLIMANLAKVPKDITEVVLKDFYGVEDVKIPLKKKLNAQENAANFYRKSKNQGKEKGVLDNRLEKLFERLEELEVQVEHLANVSEIKPLLSLESEIFDAPEKAKKKTSEFNEFEYQGYRIFIGRNSQNNDRLTLGFAGKNDLWLHAKDLAGSHVIIRNQGSDTSYPNHVIEYAAGLAAYFSKGRNREWCPVLYTPKKYIRKPKGAPAGAVHVDREEVVLVQPIKP